MCRWCEGRNGRALIVSLRVWLVCDFGLYDFHVRCEWKGGMGGR